MNEASRFREFLTHNLRGICRLTEEQAALLYAHYQLLVRWNRHLNLTSIRDLEDVVVRHYCESLFLGLHLPSNSVTVADLGSGAGFPGIPVAILRPDCKVTLIESHKRKAVFLREATRDYPNVAVSSGRGEELHERFNWVVARAVRWEQSIRLLASLGATVAVLIADQDIPKLQKLNEIIWGGPIYVPWTKNTVLVLGESCSTWNSADLPS